MADNSRYAWDNNTEPDNTKTDFAPSTVIRSQSEQYNSERQYQGNPYRDNQRYDDRNSRHAPGYDVFEGQYRQPNHYQNSPHLSTGQWVLTIFLSCIPIAGLVMLIIWAVTDNRKCPERKYWALAELILVMITVIASVIISIFLCVKLSRFNRSILPRHEQTEWYFPQKNDDSKNKIQVIEDNDLTV